MAQITAIISGKGGVGKSTFTAGISKELSARGKRVLAIDCDIGLRSLDLLLGCDEQVVFDWGDAILGRCEAQRVIIDCSVDFAAAPLTDDDAFTAEALSSFIREVAPKYDYIFLDAPAGVGKGFELAVKCAKKVIAVTTPDNICVRSCSLAIDQAEKLGITDFSLVVNMFEVKPVTKKRLLNLDECIDATATGLLGVIPVDRILAFASVTGIKPGEFSPSQQAFYRIAARFEGEKVDLVCE
ncbi:MAG: P-loop NTPase [Clostridia bacterium]|nr:P-loop NTPase [Clostridia bacterium]